MTVDLTETTQPKSDQQQFDDFIGGATRTVTVSGVSKGSLEQPVNIELAEFPGRPFRPNKSMRRVLVVCWGADSSVYVGRQLTLMGNPDVIWAGKPVGGVEIASLSHIDKPVSIPLTITRGKKKNFTVTPLEPAAPVKQRDWISELEMAGDDIDAVKALGNAAIAAHVTADVLAKIRARRDQLAGNQ